MDPSRPGVPQNTSLPGGSGRERRDGCDHLDKSKQDRSGLVQQRLFSPERP